MGNKLSLEGEQRSTTRVRWSAFALVFGGALLAVAAPSEAASNKVRISSLADVTFGTIADLGSDAIQSQSVCLYADSGTNAYDVTAIGNGPGGTFQLASGLNTLPFEVQWSASSGQSSGTSLNPNVPLTGQISSATHQVCSNGPATSASLILVLRSTALSTAGAGAYSGTLTLVVGAE